MRTLTFGIFFTGLLTIEAIADTLTILNWEEYLSPDVIQKWEEKTGHKIKEIYFDNDEARDSMLVRTEQEGIDIAIMDEPASQLFGGSGKFVAVDAYQDVPNLKHLDSFWRNRCGSYSVPYLWGTFGYAYRNDIFDTPPSSWNDILSPSAKLKGHISILKDSIDTFAPALLARGLPINTKDEKHLRQAFEDTKAIIPDVLTFEYPITYVASSPKANALHLAIVYSGDQWAMNSVSESEVWSYTVPKEGTILWVDCFAVIDKSPNKAIAFDFINFISQPEIAAQNSEELYVATTSEVAKKLQSDEMLNDKSVYPDDKVIKLGHYYEPADPKSYQLRSRMASALLKIHESE